MYTELINKLKDIQESRPDDLSERVTRVLKLHKQHITANIFNNRGWEYSFRESLVIPDTYEYVFVDGVERFSPLAPEVYKARVQAYKEQKELDFPIERARLTAAFEQHQRTEVLPNIIARLERESRLMAVVRPHDEPTGTLTIDGKVVDNSAEVSKLRDKCKKQREKINKDRMSYTYVAIELTPTDKVSTRDARWVKTH